METLAPISRSSFSADSFNAFRSARAFSLIWVAAERVEDKIEGAFRFRVLTRGPLAFCWAFCWAFAAFALLPLLPLLPLLTLAPFRV